METPEKTEKTEEEEPKSPVNPFDQPNFNPVDFINGKFPTEQSLSELDTYLMELVAEVQRVDRELLTAVRTQSMVGGKAGNDLKFAKTAITDLFGQVKQIKQKAGESEAMVQEICSDIKSLDNAKRHLTTSIKALKRIQMLESAIGNLRGLAERKDYAEASKLLNASIQLIGHFEDHANTPKIKALTNHIDTIQNGLKDDILSQYAHINLDQPCPPKLKEACMVIDAVGADVRKDFVRGFISQTLDNYKRMFHPGEDAAKLSAVEKRYKWFTKQLNSFEDNLQDAFPLHWCVPQELAVEFCLLTNAELGAQVRAEQQTLDVAVLLKVLTKTLEFEKDLTNRFRPKDPQALAMMEDDVEPVDPQSAEGLKQKYLRQKALREKQERQEAVNTHHQMKQYKFNGFIASCFETVMHLYTNHEDKAMKRTIGELLANEKWGKLEDGDEGMGSSNTAIAQSASDLFIYLNAGLKRLASFSRGQTMLEMSQVWKKHLAYFAERLANCLPKTQDDVAQVQQTCLIVNTAEYWCHTVENLVDEIINKIDEIYKKEVSMDSAQEAFSVVINKGIKCLIRGIDAKLEPAFTDMLKINWGAVMEVGDASPYVHEIERVVAARYAEIADYLTPKYLTSFSNKFGMYLSSRLMSQFHKCKKFTDMGGQQLLLDTQSLKSFLVDLPNKDGADRFQANTLNRYARIVQKEMKKAENMLKIVLTPLGANVEHLLTQYVTTTEHASIPDFIKLMELKGLTKNEYKGMVDMLMKMDNVSKTEITPEYKDDLKFVDEQPEDTSVFADVKKKFGIFGK